MGVLLCIIVIDLHSGAIHPYMHNEKKRIVLLVNVSDIFCLLNRDWPGRMNVNLLLCFFFGLKSKRVDFWYKNTYFKKKCLRSRFFFPSIVVGNKDILIH